MTTGYEKTIWINGQTAISADHLNHLEGQYDAAVADAREYVDGLTPPSAALSGLPHIAGLRYVAYGHSFGQQQPTSNTTAAAVYPNRVRDDLKVDLGTFANRTASGARTSAILNQVQSTWARGDYGVVTLLCNQNDVGDRTPETTFKSNVQGIINWIRGVGPFAPTIVVVLDTYCTPVGYARYSNPPTDSVVDQYNQFLRDVVAQYPNDGSVVIADPSAAWNAATMTAPDGQHPNDRGSAFIAQAIESALATLDYREGQNLGITAPSFIYDSFNRPNSGGIGTGMYGTSYTTLAPTGVTFGISNGAAYRSSTGDVTGEAILVTNALGSPNPDLSLKMDVITTKGAGPAWRASDLSNYWVVDIWGTGVGNAKVYKKVGGAGFVQVGAALSVEVRNGDTVRVTHSSAGDIRVYVNGTLAYSANDNALASNTMHGLRITEGAGSAVRINDLILRGA